MEAQGKNNEHLFKDGGWYNWYKLCKNYHIRHHNKEYSFKQKDQLWIIG